MRIVYSLFLILTICLGKSLAQEQKPNVVLIITDDQGYGDLGCHGNAVIQTPSLDRLYRESIRLTNFHVSPTCAPTRAALMTGRYNNRTGVWHTVMGRSLLREDEKTMADIFQAAGYKTGIFGKWHLGDNYPFRPQDRGFEEVIVHGGGGVQQIPDYWNNDYFDDTYWQNSKLKKFKGYCTDIWFQSAIQFIETHKDQPFFCYLSTNAPHSPFHVPEEYITMYKNKENVPNPYFYGMITNLDRNLAMLDKKLHDLGLADNTIFIFMTDNGTAAGTDLDMNGFPIGVGFNAGMRGKKGSPYEGGHRVPFFIRWPEGGIQGGRDITDLTAHIDLLPTLIDLSGLPFEETADFDGVSLKPLLQGNENLPDRVIITDSQRKELPEKWWQSAVMSNRWRLINGQQLYDIQTDPGEKLDVADQHPEVVAHLKDAYEKWWTDISIHFNDFPSIIIGTEEENPTRLTCHDWHGVEVPGQAALLERGIEANPPWNQVQVRKGMQANGFWAIEVALNGMYQISLHRWPKEVTAPLNSSVPAGQPVPGGERLPAGKALPIIEAGVKIGKVEKVKRVQNNNEHVTFQIPLQSGRTQLKAWFTDKENNVFGAYYVYIKRMDK